jgi:hypothetical protein
MSDIDPFGRLRAPEHSNHLPCRGLALWLQEHSPHNRRQSPVSAQAVVGFHSKTEMSLTGFLSRITDLCRRGSACNKPRGGGWSTLCLYSSIGDVLCSPHGAERAAIYVSFFTSSTALLFHLEVIQTESRDREPLSFVLQFSLHAQFFIILQPSSYKLICLSYVHVSVHLVARL